MLNFTANKKIVSIAIILILISNFSLAQIMSHKTSVEVMGTENIIRNNTNQARNTAIQKSLKKSVEKVYIELLSTDILTSHYSAIHSLINKNSRDYIEGYKVLAEAKTKKKYSVFVQAEVSISKILLNLSNQGIILDLKNMPSILLLIAEQNINDNISNYWWGGKPSHLMTLTELSFSEIMKKRGYIVKSHNGLIQSHNSVFNTKTNQDNQNQNNNEEQNNNINSIINPALLTANLDNDTAVKIGLTHQADVVIVGKSTGFETINKLGSNKSVKSLISIKAIRTDTGEEIALVTKSATVINANLNTGYKQAIAKAIKEAGDSIASKIMKAWQIENNKLTTITVEITGKNLLSSLIKLKNSIKELKGVHSIQTKKFQKNSSVLLIEFQGNAKLLANNIISNSNTSFAINISDLVEDFFKIELVSTK